MTGFWVRYPRLLILSLCLIVVLGVSALRDLPRMEQPPLSSWYATVTTQFPGASAARVEALITEPVEAAMYSLADIKIVFGNSRPGLSTVILELQEETRDIDAVWAKARSKVDEVIPELPAGVEPIFEEVQINAHALIVGLVWSAPSSPPYGILNRLAEDLADDLQVLSGTDKVDFYGEVQEEILVDVDPLQLASLGLTPSQLLQQIQASDPDVAAGELDGRTQNLLLEVTPTLEALDPIRNIGIRPAPDQGQVLRLQDLAHVHRGIEHPSEISLINGQEAVVLAVRIDPQQQVDRWTQRAKAVLDRYRPTLPPDVQLQVIYEQQRYVAERFQILNQSLLLGSGLVLLSMMLLLGPLSGLAVGSIIPLALLSVFAGLEILSIPLHQITVMGLVVSLGMLVDNAIIVVDELQQRLTRNLSMSEALEDTIRFLTPPLLASTLTTILGFLPVVLIPGDAGEFVGGLGISVILTLVASLLLALTLVAAIAVHLLSRSRTDSWWQRGISFPGLVQIYQRGLIQIFAHPSLSTGMILLVPLAGFLVSRALPEQFFPPADRDQVLVEVELWPQAPLAQTRATTLQVERRVKQYPEVQDLFWFLGRNTPLFYNNLERTRRYQSHYAQGLLTLTQRQVAPEMSGILQQALGSAFPAAQIRVEQIGEGPYIAAPLEIYLYGPELNVLQRLGEEIRLFLSQDENITQTRASLNDVIPQLTFNLYPDQAPLINLDAGRITQEFRTYLEGIEAGTMLEAPEELPIRVRMLPAASLETLAAQDLVVGTGTAITTVPMGTLGDFRLHPEYALLPRRRGQRVNTVQGFLRTGALASEALTHLQDRIQTENFTLPQGYEMEIGGEAAERSAVVQDLTASLDLILALMGITLALLLGSIRAVAVIALIALCSVGLGLASLWIFGYPLGFMAILGTVSLVGVAINDAIVVWASLQADHEARQGEIVAVAAVVVRATRHVFTTSVTTIVGFAPLLLTESQLWPPMAICIVGGIGGATLLALILVPCIHLLAARSKFI